ncbi:MAG: 4a-hydroxytetrahydrobiopterin dehydratase [Polyangiaceae bacterium]|jgi:4a-hydroxytetrahydrobiopterin dehydratase|nr:4a-hydroxytetrahydrobiopterin dehydratase [Polyangiaceae bacterium]
MTPTRLPHEALIAWLDAHPGWSIDQDHLQRSFTFPDYPATIAFVTRLAFAAEKLDHHPDLLVSWGRVLLRVTTHDAGGLSPLDLSLAEHADALAR